MWEKSMIGLSSLIKRTTPSSFAYICEKNGNSLTNKVKNFKLSSMSQLLFTIFCFVSSGIFIV